MSGTAVTTILAAGTCACLSRVQKCKQWQVVSVGVWAGKWGKGVWGSCGRAVWWVTLPPPHHPSTAHHITYVHPRRPACHRLEGYGHCRFAAGRRHISFLRPLHARDEVNAYLLPTFVAATTLIGYVVVRHFNISLHRLQVARDICSSAIHENGMARQVWWWWEGVMAACLGLLSLFYQDLH